MKVDIKSLLIGILLTICISLAVGFKSGDLTTQRINKNEVKTLVDFDRADVSGSIAIDVRHIMMLEEIPGSSNDLILTYELPKGTIQSIKIKRIDAGYEGDWQRTLNFINRAGE